MAQDLQVIGRAGPAPHRTGGGPPETCLPSRLAVLGARVMWLDEAQPCPTYPGVTLDGLAVAPDGQRHYLVLTVRPRSKPPFLLHVGPDPDAVGRIGLIIAAALQTYGGDLADPIAGAAVLGWLAACWTEAASELDAAAGSYAGTGLDLP